MRIGNLVNRLGNPTKINAIQIDIEGAGYLSTERTGAITKNQVDPIPLTEEWIKKFGFVLRNRVDYESNCGVLDLESTDAGYLFDSRIIIKSVHQLQNLFYCLCGKELELLQ